MNATLWDLDVLSLVQPQSVEAYLRNHDWHERNRIPGKVSIWTRDTFSEDKLKIQVPLDQDFDDFPRRIQEVLETLEIAENRSQLEILSDLLTAAANIQIQGMVTAIPEGDANGIITMMGFVVGKPRQIYIRLGEYEYNLAVKAYRERLPVVCVGDLIKQGGKFVLKKPRNFALYTDI